MGRTRVIGWVLSFSLMLVACGGDSDDGSTTGATMGPGTTTTTGSTGAMGEPAGALADGPLEPGTYTFDGFVEPITFTIGEGWEADIGLAAEDKIGTAGEEETELTRFFALFHEDHPDASLGFLAPLRVVDPAKDWDEEGNLVAVPDDLIAWMTDHPFHEAEPPFDATVGTLPARAVDIRVAEVPENGWPNCGQCILWFPLSVRSEEGPLTAGDDVWGEDLDGYDRLLVVELSGRQLLVDVGATARMSFDEFIPVAEEVLATVDIG
jgi:hypothetical protein